MSYLRWSGERCPDTFEVEIVQEKASELQIADADSDIIFEKEQIPLTKQEYQRLKLLALKSAEDFMLCTALCRIRMRAACRSGGRFMARFPGRPVRCTNTRKMSTPIISERSVWTRTTRGRSSIAG